MCFSVFSSTVLQVGAVGTADKLFSVKSSVVKNGKITYTVSLSGGVEGFGGAIVLIEYDNTVLAPAKDGFKPAYTSSGVQQFDGVYVNGITAADPNVYSVAYTNTIPESVESNTEFFSITFDVINEERPSTKVIFKCKEFFSTTDSEQSITVADGLQTIERIEKVVTIESPETITAELATGKIVVKWKASQGAVSYRLQRKTPDGAWGSEYTTVSADKHYYNDVLELESGETYMYRIQAVNEDGVTSVYKSMTASCRYVAKPTDVTAVNGVGGIDITWSETKGADSYIIMRRESGAKKWTVLTERSSTQTTFYKDTTVESGKTYEYDVNSTYGEFTTETLKEGKIVAYLASPEEITGSNISGGIELKWKAVENASYYVIYRKAISTEAKFTKYATVFSNSFIDPDGDVEVRKAYTYKIKAVNDYGESAVTKTGCTITRVPATTVTKVEPLSDKVVVYFKAIDDIDGYYIYRKTKSTDWRMVGVASADARNFEDTKATSGISYYYCAVPFIGNSESEKISTTNSCYYLKSPQNVTVVNTKDALKVTWDAVGGAEKYSVFRRLGKTGEFTLVKTVKADSALRYIDEDVKVNSICYYKVQAVSSRGKSLESEITPATMRILCVKGVESKITSKGIFIEWSSHKSADNYFVYRKESGGEWKKIGETEARKFTDTTVKSGKTYSYGIVPVVDSYKGDIDEDEIVTIKYIASPTITEITNYKATVKVEWKKVGGAKKYRLQRVVLDADWNASGSYKTIATVSETSFKDTDLVAGRRYRYRVYAVTDDAISVASTSVKNIFLATPEITSRANSYGGIKIEWNSVKNARNYSIMRKESGGEWKTIKTLSSSKTAYTDKTAKNGVKYYYAVRAITSDCRSYYAARSFTYYASPEVTLSNKVTAITVSWKKIPGTKSYYVYRKAPDENSWKKVAVATKTSYTDKNVKDGKTYKYTVKAYNGKIFSGYNTNGWTIKRLTPPTLKAISNKTNGVFVDWSKVTGATGYIVYRKTSTTNWTEVGKTKKGTSFIDETAVEGKIYTYTVVATSGKYRSTYIAEGLKIKRLERPELESVKSYKTGIKFKWETVTGASGYYVYRKTGSGDWKQLAKVTDSSTSSYFDKTAKKGKTYYYSVRAYSGSYKSAYNTKGLKIKDKY